MKDIHAAAEIFPELPEKEFKDLTESIRVYGLHDPIEVLDGQVIDGRHRQRACAEAGVTPEYREVNLGELSPTQYVVLKNVHRRHLTPSQRALIAARVREIFDNEAKERQKTSSGGADPVPVNLPEARKGDARDQAGASVGVSGKSVDHATKVLDSGRDDLIEAVEGGTMSVSKAVSELSPKSAEVESENRDTAKLQKKVDRLFKSFNEMTQMDRDWCLDYVKRWLQQFQA